MKITQPFWKSTCFPDPSAAYHSSTYYNSYCYFHYFSSLPVTCHVFVCNVTCPRVHWMTLFLCCCFRTIDGTCHSLQTTSHDLSNNVTICDDHCSIPTLGYLIVTQVIPLLDWMKGLTLSYMTNTRSMSSRVSLVEPCKRGWIWAGQCRHNLDEHALPSLPTIYSHC